MINILKASAGSGKTWNLARYYIRLMLEKKDPFSYRHILAVTFTNKATDEMKDRILKELHILASDPCGSDYYDDFVPALYPDAKSLAEASSALLCNILHDYSAFAVSTIDRFFQQTLRAFSREIGHFASYAIELDKDSLVKESVDRYLDSLTESEEHSRSLEWMIRKTMAQLEEGEGYRLDKTLRNIADRFNSEEFRAAVKKAAVNEQGLYTDENLDRLDKTCDEVCEAYPKIVKEGAEKLFRRFEQEGINPADTQRHFMDTNLRKYSLLETDKPVPPPTDAFRKNALDLDLWFGKKNSHLKGPAEALMGDVQEFFGLFDHEYKVYNTAMMLKKQIYSFAVASDLYENFKAILKEKNVLTIDQTNTILRDIIDGSDTPFVYEKIGVRYDHFLLGEFQDTSLVQWDNFKPLLENSVSQNCENLIVGDVKQSIYRWRQSDWELLENQVQKDFAQSTAKPLDTNYRSAPEIVNFNNAYFEATAKYLDKMIGDDSDVIRKIYSDVQQEVNKSYQGMVEVAYCEPDDHLACILDRVRKAQEKGFRLGEITVLVRTNKEGGEIANYLISEGIPVVSDDSLKVASSLTVRRLVSLMAGIENPEDSVSRHLASSLGIDVPENWHSLVDLCEDLLRRLSKADPETFAAETLYIQSFMDKLMEYVSLEGNSLRGFLKKWAEDKSNISSPESDESVRIMTVHKSKGLAFPYVIFPSMGGVEFFTHEKKWSRPDVKGSRLEEVAGGVYDVTLSGKSKDTLFKECFEREKLMQYIDNINVVYVALTRASHAMSIITPLPEGVAVTADGYAGDEKNFSNFSQWTMAYMAGAYKTLDYQMIDSEDTVDSDASGESEGLNELIFMTGELTAPERKTKASVEMMPSVFCSWPLNSSKDGEEAAEECERGRLKLSADAIDFFSEDGRTGASASNRIRGVVLHDILSEVVLPEDLEGAVRKAQNAGYLDKEEAKEAYELLSKRIAEVAGSGWFPDDRNAVLNETALIDTDGMIYRPDRVVISDGKVLIVDYKFGEPDTGYRKQVERYAGIWRRMGYADVSASLWYVMSGDIENY